MPAASSPTAPFQLVITVLMAAVTVLVTIAWQSSRAAHDIQTKMMETVDKDLRGRVDAHEGYLIDLRKRMGELEQRHLYETLPPLVELRKRVETLEHVTRRPTPGSQDP